MRISHSFGPLALTIVIVAAPLAAQSTDSMKHDGDEHREHMTSHEGERHHGEMEHHAMFHASSGHGATGSVEISREHGRQRIEFSDDFSLTGAPDAYIVLAAGDTPDAKSLWLPKLSSLKGKQEYDLPSSADASQYSKVLLWSKQHNMVVASADLARHGEMMHK
jgi:hypothetical protein